jgi:xylan 1,4-beta-xylosidase
VKTIFSAFVIVLWAAALLCAQQTPVIIRVDATAVRGEWKPAWNFFGYDEPNYTYAEHGRKLLGQLSALSPVPVYIRTHNLLTSGDGSASLKWGSTNAYTEANGRAVYDWTILDRIFDAYRDARVKPLVEIGFMPGALSEKPEPYRHDWPRTFSTGWAYPPRDYAQWGELVYQWVRHDVGRYGAGEVATWYWEVWNEPDISYWRGTPEEYYQLYDYAVDAIKRALPAARVGGPHSTGPSSAKAAAFLRAFLEHCARGKNYATGATGAPLDYVGFHAKGSPALVEGRVRMGMRKQARDIDAGFEIVASFPEFRGKPVIIGESDPEGCAACSARLYPQNAYRNGILYAAYTAAMLNYTLELAGRRGVRLQGAVTWAFEFENQPWFDGLRTLATNGIPKPVLNAFRMFGRLKGDRLKVESDGAVDTSRLLEAGVGAQPDINAIATRSGRGLEVLIWNYHDDEAAAPDADVRLVIAGLPREATRVEVRHLRVDQQHSNAYTAWKQMGSPQEVSPAQYARLEAASQLQPLEAPQRVRSAAGSVGVSFKLPRHALSLLELSW